MKFLSYYRQGPRIGVQDGERIWDIRRVVELFLLDVERSSRAAEIAAALVPADMPLFIRLNHARLADLERALDHVKSEVDRRWADELTISATEMRLLPAIVGPSKIVCCGNSYARYLREWGLERAEWPQDVKISFFKPPTALLSHGETIRFPPDSEQWDYENELAVVIGRSASNIREEDADDHIFGYSILNDACVRDIPSWAGRYDSPRGKACDTFAPFGPCIVPGRYLGRDPNDLGILTTVDGEIRQQDRTSGLLWSVQRIVAYVSRYITLAPGDIVSTGSTTGNALVSRKWLKPGQKIRCEIEGIGSLENSIAERVWTNTLRPANPLPVS